GVHPCSSVADIHDIHDDRIVIRKRLAALFQVWKCLRVDARDAGLFIDDFAGLKRSQAARSQPVESKLQQQAFRSYTPAYPPFHRAWEAGRIVQARNNCPAGRASIVEAFDLVAEPCELADCRLARLGMTQSAIQTIAVAGKN